MRLLVADPRALLRAGLARLLADLGPVETVEAGTLAGAMERADPGFAAAFVAESLLGGEGVGAFCARHPALPHLVLADAEEPAAILAAIRAGAKGYIPLSSPPATLLAALRLVLDTGGPYLPPGLARLAPAPAPPAERPLLTPRQRDVLDLLARGRGNREIAAALLVTEGTAKLHVATVMKSLGVTSRAAAVRRGEELGLVRG